MRTRHGVLAAAVALLLAGCGVGESQSSRSPEAAPPIGLFPMGPAAEDARLHFFDGLRLQDVGRFTEAHASFKRAIAADPSFVAAYLGALETAPSFEDFRENLERAVELAGNASEEERLLVEMARLEFERNLEGALELAQRLAEMHPTNPRAWIVLAWRQSGIGREAEARASWQKAVELAPDWATPHALLGNSYILVDPVDYALAERHLLRTVELIPDEPGGYDLLGDLRRQQGRFEEARDAYTRMAEINHQEGLAYQQRAHVNSFLHDYPAARRDYDLAISHARGNMRAGFARFRAYVNLFAGDPRAAVEELEQLYGAIDGLGVASPLGQKISTLSDQAIIAYHAGLFDAADRAAERWAPLMWQRAEEVGTEEFRRATEAQIAIAEGYAAAFRGQYDLARRKAEEYMSLREPDRDPLKNRPAHALLGLIELRQQHYEEAVEHYRQTDPDDMYTVYHHGLALEALGRADEARPLFQRIASYGFNNLGAALVRAEAAARLNSR